MAYISQVENQVSNIFVMDEGIIIEFSTVYMPTYQEIRNKSHASIEEYSSKTPAKQPSTILITQNTPT